MRKTGDRAMADHADVVPETCRCRWTNYRDNGGWTRTSRNPDCPDHGDLIATCVRCRTALRFRHGVWLSVETGTVDCTEDVHAPETVTADAITIARLAAELRLPETVVVDQVQQQIEQRGFDAVVFDVDVDWSGAVLTGEAVAIIRTSAELGTLETTDWTSR